MTNENECIFSVDVEDWFHILELPPAPDIEQWNTLPSRVSKNFRSMLEIFSEKNVKVTCFFLGWVAEKYPELVKEAHTLGHEIASHGYSHTLLYNMSPKEFLFDITKAKDIIENIIGTPVLGYRAPGFSVTKDTPWFFDTLAEAGYRFDSSVFPAPRQHGGINSANLSPYTIDTAYGQITEFPITVAHVFGHPMCFFGGGYLRLSPYFLIKKMAEQVIQQHRPVIFYIHPREIDPYHPRMPMSPIRRFKSYVNLHTTQSKIEKILNDFSITTFSDYLANINL
jgi:polysaccharide deacetylase family protein (PEP-CTERM system associated)